MLVILKNSQPLENTLVTVITISELLRSTEQFALTFGIHILTIAVFQISVNQKLSYF